MLNGPVNIVVLWKDDLVYQGKKVGLCYISILKSCYISVRKATRVVLGRFTIIDFDNFAPVLFSSLSKEDFLVIVIFKSIS